MNDLASLQRSYYRATAAQYDEMHGEDPAHTFALSFLTSVVDHLQAHSILDVGVGTGRVRAFLAEKRPETNVIGIEPVLELRERGYEKGVPRSSLIEGLADALPSESKSFDLVCAFGVMHNLVDPSKAALKWSGSRVGLFSFRTATIMAAVLPLRRH
jgi:ubiquinone/menaquinone biosynthesis C-methylase UbiE